MDKTFVNIFNGVTDQDTSKRISVLDVVWKISEGEWKGRIESYRNEPDKKRKESMKKNLPAVTFSGSLDGKGRLDDNIKNYTGILVCDVDKIPQSKLNLFKNRLRGDGHVLAFFESPSRGLKILVRVNSGLEHHKSHAFVQVQEYMMTHYEIVIDPSGKNPSRLCFMSYDPEMYYNEDAEVFPVDISIDYKAMEIESSMQSVKGISDDLEVSSDSGYVFDTVCRWISDSAVGSYHKGNRNNFIFSLSCRLSEAGMAIDTTVAMILSRYSSLKFEEVKVTVRSAYKRTSASFGSRPLKQRVTNQTKMF